MNPGAHATQLAAKLPAAAYSFVMAAGIVSVSLLLHDQLLLSRVLLGVAAIGFVVLIALSILQLTSAPASLRRMLAAPHSRFGFFTFVAASGVLGTRLTLADVSLIPTAQLVIAGVAWVAIGWLVVGRLRRDNEPRWSLADGSWFLAAVATNSIGVLAASLADHTRAASLAWLALVAWIIGVMLYGVVLALVVVRVARRRVGPGDLTAPYWITMGACAITVLDAAKISALPAGVLPHWVQQLTTVGGLGFWVLATVLIPVILAAGWWRHVHHRVPLDGPMTLWSIVFPLGMYDVASTLMAQDHHLAVARLIGDFGMWVALLAWIATGGLLLGRGIQAIRKRAG